MSEAASTMRFGLALSGGGFRAALYHLGVVRLLRDCGLLAEISHIAAVSGGSIIGAHLVLNWERYCGTDEQFVAVSNELLRLVRIDVRNRIVRRFPLFAAVNLLRRLALIGPTRRFTRIGLLEWHYERLLLGDCGLIELPESPRLYILATDLNQGSLCAFCREGLLMQHRVPAKHAVEVELIHMGLATVPMAVAASSAFPGFFPPLQLARSEVDPSEVEFCQHAFTDGGIYDNLGLRLFYFLQGRGGARREHVESAPHVRLDCILVSDAGASFKMSLAGGSGLLRTALRSSDILMDRVNQLERNTFAASDDAVFMPITRIIEPAEDPAVMHPEIQRRTAQIRTDMDRFSKLEIAALVRHGYCVARQALRESTLAATRNLPLTTDAPWDPMRTDATDPIRFDDPAVALRLARKLQGSANRRFMSSLFQIGDWPTYIWLPLLLGVVLGIPYLMYRLHQTARQERQVLSAVAQSSPLYADVLQLLGQQKAKPLFPLRFEEVPSVGPLDFTGYEVISDDRVYDLRGWTSNGAPSSAPRMHARFRILRTPAARDRPRLRIQLPSEQPAMRALYLPESLRPVHVRARLDDGSYIFQTFLDFSRVPIGTETTVVVMQDMPERMASQEYSQGHFKFTVAAHTGLVRLWILLPAGRAHGQFELYRSPIGTPGEAQIVHATTTVEVPQGAIATFQMINPPEGYRYDCRWSWLGEASSSQRRR